MMNRFLLQSLALISLLLVFPGITLAQTPEDIQKIISSYDLAKLKALENQFSQQYQTDKKKALSWAEERKTAIFKRALDSSWTELQRIEPDGTPIYFKTHANNAVISARLNYLYGEGSLGLNLMGQNMTAYVWDGGYPRITHYEYDGPYAENRVSIEDAAQEGGVSLLWHAGMVTGIIASAGLYEPNAIGMAPYCRIKNYKWNNHLAEATAAAANGMLLSNHSYGWDTAGLAPYLFGSYNTETADWDNLLYNAPYYLMVTSAGNDGQAGLVYDQLTGRQLCKNNLTIANVTDAVIDNFGNLVSTTVFSTSSTGPTDELRIKPDLSGNGVSVSGTDIGNDYSSMFHSGGTSFAAPNVTGSLLLLQQHYKNLNGSFMKAATLKGLALHTADDVGTTGPDARAGWGLINAKAAVQTISRNGTKSIVSELTLPQGQSYNINVTADGINKLMASVSWTDAPGTPTAQLNSPLSRLVNDLDIRVTKGGSTYYPYKLLSNSTNGLGDNNVDPFERIDVANASGVYTITVTHKGSLNTGSQNFSLIVTGISANCQTSVPFEITFSEYQPNSVNLKWKNTLDNFYTIRYRVIGNATWTTQTVSEKEAKLFGLQAFTNYEVQVNSFCPQGGISDFSPSAFFTTSGIYCSASSSGIVNEEISSVILNNLNYYSEGSTSSGYSDFTNQTATMIKGQTQEITIKPTLWNTASRGYAAWIDYNRNGTFTDAGELIFSQSPTTVTSVTRTFTVPSVALAGGTRMRIAMKVSGIPASCDTGFANGEVEDYTVIIKDSACNGQTIWDGTTWSNGLPNANLHAVINANYTGNGFSACRLDVNGTAAVTINSGTNLIIDGNINVGTTATLKLLNDCNIWQSKTAVNSGNVKIRRTTSALKRLDYVLWGSPVANQNLQGFSPQTIANRFYTYNSATNFYNVIDPGTNVFSKGLGYLIRMPNNHPTTPTTWTGEFNGVPHNGDFTIQVPTYSYVAVANPYPSTIDCFPLMIENELYYEPIYFWRKENNSLSSSYATYTPYLGGLANAGDPNQVAPTRYLSVGQGFIVKTDYRNTIDFRNTMRVTQNRNPFLRTTAEEFDNNQVHKLYLSLNSVTGISSNAMIGYLAGATSAVDAFIDGRYINDSPNALTSLIDGEEFTLQGRGLPFDQTDEVPLGFKTQEAGDYWLSLASVSGFFAQEQAVFLEDSQTQTVHDLKSGPYQFSTEPGVFNNRFKIKYRNGLLATTNPIVPDQVSVSVKNSILIIAAQNSLLKAIHLFDLTGRKLMGAKDLNLKESRFDLTAYQCQVLLVKIETTDGKIVTHRIVN